MDIDTMSRENRCFKCGKADRHFARNCQTPITEIRRKFGCDRMYQPGGRSAQNRVTDFANMGEYTNAMSQADREELARAL